MLRHSPTPAQPLGAGAKSRKHTPHREGPSHFIQQPHFLEPALAGSGGQQSAMGFELGTPYPCILCLSCEKLAALIYLLKHAVWSTHSTCSLPVGAGAEGRGTTGLGLLLWLAGTGQNRVRKQEEAPWAILVYQNAMALMVPMTNTASSLPTSSSC